MANETEEIIASLSVIDTDNVVDTEVEGYQISEIVGPTTSSLRITIPTEWMIDDGWTFSFLNSLKTIDVNEIIRLQSDNNERIDSSKYKIQDGVAYIDISGALMKKPSCMSMLMGSDGSYIQYRSAIRAAVADDKVNAIALIIDSPGGEVSGAFDLANDIYILSQKKSIYAYIEDVGASAAYLAASQTLQVWANSSAHVGSIGVYTTVKDSSKAAENAGIKINVIKAGKYKAGEIAGAPVTDEHLADLQKRVDSIQSLFVKAISRGRQMTAEDLTKVADASMHIGSSAKKVKLVDQIGTLDEFHNKIVGKKFITSRKDSQMSAELSDVTRWLGDNTVPEPTVATQVSSEETIAKFLKQNNVKDVTELKQLQEQAKFGVNQETKIREQVAALAIVALDVEDGTSAKELISSLPIEQVQSLAKQYIKIGQSKGLLSESGVPIVRNTAGSAPTGDNGVISSVPGSETKETIVKKSAEFLLQSDRAGLYLPF